MLASTYDCMSCYENFAIMLHLHTCMYAYTHVQAFAPIIVHTCGKHSTYIHGFHHTPGGA